METAIRREVMRCAMLGWLAREAAFEPRSIAEADAAIAVIETKAAAVRSAIRLRDPRLALAPVAAAAAALGLAIEPAALPRVGRAVLGVLAELHDAELHVESGATVEEARRVLRDVHFGGRPPERLAPPVRLATAVEKAIERAPTRQCARSGRAQPLSGRCLVRRSSPFQPFRDGAERRRRRAASAHVSGSCQSD